MTETQNTSRRPGALIAMSGGVDSSVAAWLMQRDGFDCTGVTMRLTRNEAVNTEGLHTCCSERDIEDAAEVAYAMDIPYEVLDFTADFQEKIIDKFIRVYEAGGTPNPCIDCNRYMKFDHLLRWAEAHGLDYVVTGHYARVEQDEATGRWLLKKGLDENKDQSYVLYNLTQEQLAHVRLPLGGLHKSEVRAIAEQQHFVNARKHDSQDICFVPDEELGEQGARKLDLTKFPVDWAYTIDCCELGEVVWETFNAGNAKLTVKGIPAHPMSSKGVMVNPTLVVHDFLNMLDRAATPECTEGREGFIVVKGIQSNPSKAVLTMKVRDHNRKLYEEKKNLLKAAAEFLRVRHPRAGIELELSDSYANIADAVTNANHRLPLSGARGNGC